MSQFPQFLGGGLSQLGLGLGLLGAIRQPLSDYPQQWLNAHLIAARHQRQMVEIGASQAHIRSRQEVSQRMQDIERFYRGRFWGQNLDRIRDKYPRPYEDAYRDLCDAEAIT